MSTTSYTQFSVISPGLYTTVQDQGRYGYQQFGVPVSGALDTFSANIANNLVCNKPDAAVLEITLVGPKLYVLEEGIVAVTGADLSVQLNGDSIPTWKSLRVRKGDTLEIGKTARSGGCRAYLAVSGGFAVDSVMGSRSCYFGGRFGGGSGIPLIAGNKLKRYAQVFPGGGLELPEQHRPHFTQDIVLHAIPGPQDDFFDSGLETFYTSEFTVSQDADRMGYRLTGPEIVQKNGLPQSIISEPSFPGGVQIPPNGNPIILLNEQTVGGYSKIATVISTDICKVAQATPGDRIRFVQTSLEEAYALKREDYERNQNITTALHAQLPCKPTQVGFDSALQDDVLERFNTFYPECHSYIKKDNEW